MGWEVYDRKSADEIKGQLRCCTMVDNFSGPTNFGELHPNEEFQIRCHTHMARRNFS